MNTMQELNETTGYTDVFGPYIRDYINIMLCSWEHMPTILGFIGKHLPCSQCSEHCLEYVEKTDLTTPSLQYVLDLHNLVNARNGKPEWSEEEYITYMKEKYSLAIPE